MWYTSDSTISESTKVNIRGYLSINVTRTPRVAKILVNSHPMTPAPTTVSVRGRRSRPKMSSLVKICIPSKGTLSGLVADVPVAIMILSAVTSRWPLPSV